MRKETNLILFLQDLIDNTNGFDISKTIEDSYKTFCYCLHYDLNERITLANKDSKKFGFVLKSLKK